MWFFPLLSIFTLVRYHRRLSDGLDLRKTARTPLWVAEPMSWAVGCPTVAVATRQSGVIE